MLIASCKLRPIQQEGDSMKIQDIGGMVRYENQP